MAKRKAATTVRKTPNFDFLFGRYSHSNCVIPYFQISMSLNDAAKYLRLVNEMPGAASMNWKIEELFQRDIDWLRVERKIVPYLRNNDQPQFFNALTIALLPIRNNAMGSFLPAEIWDAPALDNADDFVACPHTQFGPIACGYWGEWDAPSDDNARSGQLCWNTDQVCGVAIDGQHRLAAIKQLVGTGSDLYRDTSVPVLLVVLHPSLGFNKSPTRETLVDTLRSLFIDLNKHARTVSRARQILLDDRDPASICVRTVVGSQLRSGHTELQGVPPTLPLSLVDWHSEQAKFDVGPYLTTILGLDWAVTTILSIRPFEDPMAFGETHSLLEKLERKLGIQLSEAKGRLEECRRFERPFAFAEEPVNELARIADGFRNRWCRPLLHILSKFEPYQALINLRDTLVTLRPEFANWFALKVGAGNATGSSRASHLLDEFEGQLANREDDPVAISDFHDALVECGDLKSEREFAFTVVFQRALIIAFLQFTKITDNMFNSSEPASDFNTEDALDDSDDEDEIDDDADDDDADHADSDDSATDQSENGVGMQRAEQLIAALNHLVSEEPDFLTKECEFVWDDDDEHQSNRFWLCSLVQPEGPIDFTQGASKRASDILLLVGLFWLYRESNELGEDAFNDLMNRADEAVSGIDLKLSLCLSRMWINEKSIAGRIVSSRDERADDDDLRWAEIRGRASWLSEIMWR